MSRFLSAIRRLPDNGFLQDSIAFVVMAFFLAVALVFLAGALDAWGPGQ